MKRKYLWLPYRMVENLTKFNLIHYFKVSYIVYFYICISGGRAMLIMPFYFC